jgi:hypothetical protein
MPSRARESYCVLTVRTVYVTLATVPTVTVSTVCYLQLAKRATRFWSRGSKSLHRHFLGGGVLPSTNRYHSRSVVYNCNLNYKASSGGVAATNTTVATDGHVRVRQ